MKKKLEKKLVLKKHTVASLDAKQLEALRGGDQTINFLCNSKQCVPTATVDFFGYGGCG